MRILDYILNRQNLKEQDNDPTKSFASTGNEIYSGYPQEEFLGRLRDNREKFEILDQMRREESTIQMCIEAFGGPIRSADWRIKIKEKFVDTPEGEAQFEMITRLIREDFVNKYVVDSLTAATFGFVLWERYWKPREIDGQIFLSPKLKFMSQRSIEQWMYEGDDLVAVRQEAYGDDFKNIFLSAERLVHMAIRQEGNNAEGISLIRSAYGPWVRKRANYKKIAIGNHYLSLPFLLITNNSNVALSSEQLERFEERLQQRADVQSGDNRVKKALSHIVFPRGFDAREIATQFDPMKLYACNAEEDKQMVRSFLATFLLLGNSGGSGSYALADTIVDFFLLTLNGFASDIKSKFNEEIIKKTVEMNTQEECMVELSHSKVGDKGGEAFAKSINTLMSVGAIKPDKPLEEHLRSIYGLTKVDNETREETVKDEIEPQVTLEKKVVMQKEVQVTMKELRDQAKDAHKRIKVIREKMLEVIEEEGKILVEKKVKKIAAHLKKNWGTQNLFKIRPDELSMSTNDIVKKIKEVVLGETEKESLVIQEKFNFQAKTPKTAQTMIGYLIASDVASYESSINNAMLYSLAEAINTSKEQTAVLGIVTKIGEDAALGKKAKDKLSVLPSKAVNEIRKAEFESNLGERIESYTWYNPSPVADICQYLAGKTVSANDPMKDVYQPPLHYNCTTVLTPNLKEFKGNPKVEVIAPNKKQIESASLSITGATV